MILTINRFSGIDSENRFIASFPVSGVIGLFAIPKHISTDGRHSVRIKCFGSVQGDPANTNADAIYLHYNIVGFDNTPNKFTLFNKVFTSQTQFDIDAIIPINNSSLNFGIIKTVFSDGSFQIENAGTESLFPAHSPVFYLKKEEGDTLINVDYLSVELLSV